MPGSDVVSALATRQELAALLTELRDRAGWSLRRLGAEIGRGYTTVGDWCAGRALPNPSQERDFEAMLRALSVTDTAPWLATMQRLRRESSRRSTDRPTPYLGLRPYSSQHAGWFFGRQELVEHIHERFQELTEVAPHRDGNRQAQQEGSRVLVVVGASGAGKSSLLHAGLGPRLVQDGVSVVSMTPGADPMQRLAEVLAQIPGIGGVDRDRHRPDDPLGWLTAPNPPVDDDDRRVGSVSWVLMVDQFEEVFTECTDAERRDELFSALARLSVSGSGGAVVVGLRIDFYAQLAACDQLAGALEDAQVLVGPMSPDELTAAIVEPARVSGCSVDDELVRVLHRDFVPSGSLQQRPDAGALPLLSHALLETWRLASHGRMTVADYQRAGGVAGAVEQSAERVFDSLTPQQQTVTRDVFLRLIHVDGVGPVTRRTAPWSELDGLSTGLAAPAVDPALTASGHTEDPSRADGDADRSGCAAEVVEAFVRARLLTVGGSTVEIVHEALLGAWPRLRAWIDDDREALLLHQRMAEASRMWVGSGQDPSMLARGSWLDELRPLLDPGDDPSALVLSTDERQFVTASVAQVERAERQRRRRVRRARALASVAVVLAVVSSGLAVVTARARSDAVAARDAALSRQVAVTAEWLAGRDTAVAAQLAVAAYQIAPTPEARAALMDVAAEPLPTRYVGGSGSTAVAITRSGELLATSGAISGTIDLINPNPADGTIALDGAGRAGVITLGDEIAAYALAFTPDDNVLVIGDETARITLWDVSDPAAPTQLGEPLKGPSGAIQRIDISPDGRELAAVGATDFNDVNATRGADDEPVEVDGVFRWSLDDPASPDPLPAIPVAANVVWSVVYRPDGQHLAFGHADEEGVAIASLWNIAGDPERVTSVEPGTGYTATVAFSADGGHLAAGTPHGQLAVWDLTNPTRPARVDIIDGQFASWVNDIAFSPDGRYLVAGSSDADLRVWDTRIWRPVAHLPHPVNITQIAFDHTGRLVTAAVDGTARMWHLRQSIRYQMRGADGAPANVFALGFNNQGDRLAVLSGEEVGIWDITDDDVGWRNLGDPIAGLEGDPGSAGTGAISPSGTLLARGSIAAGGGQLRLYDLAAGKPQQIEVDQDSDRGTLHAAGFSADERIVAAGGVDADVRLWDLTDRDRPRLATTIDDPDGIVLSIDWHPHDPTMAVASADGHVYLYDVTNIDTPLLLARLDRFESEAYAAEFNPDGTLLATAGTDAHIQVWNIQDPTEPSPVADPIEGPTGRVFDLAFHPTSNLLAAGVTDGTTWIWELDTTHHADLLATLGPVDDPIFPVAFHPTHDMLIRSGSNGIVRTHQLDSDTTINRICSTIGTPITEEEWTTLLPHTTYRTPCR